MIEVIPAIDLIEGKCVRLSQGDYSQSTTYANDPLDMARMFEDAGFSRLHLVDLDGAREGAVVNWEVLERICTYTSLVVDFGGGIKLKKDVQKVLQAGASFVVVGSLAVKQPDTMAEMIQEFGAERFILGADVRNGMIAISGWTETSTMSLKEFIGMYVQKGILDFLCTDINKDGMLEGPAISLYSSLMKQYPNLQLIASGGVASTDDIWKLQEAAVPKVVVGKAFYEGRIDAHALAETLRLC